MLSNETRSGAIFLGISSGLITQKIGDEKVTFRKVSGTITAISTSEKEYEGKPYTELSLTITSDRPYRLQMHLDSAYGRAFLNMLPNIDLQLTVEIEPFMRTKDSKDEYGLFMRQQGKALKHFYTRATPNGMPPLKEVVLNGKKHYDKTEQKAFYLQLIADVQAKLPHPAVAQNAPAETTYDAPAAADGADDDLPF